VLAYPACCGSPEMHTYTPIEKRLMLQLKKELSDRIGIIQEKSGRQITFLKNNTTFKFTITDKRL
jgi:hypothetical protein